MVVVQSQVIWIIHQSRSSRDSGAVPPALCSFQARSEPLSFGSYYLLFAIVRPSPSHKVFSSSSSTRTRAPRARRTSSTCRSSTLSSYRDSDVGQCGDMNMVGIESKRGEADRAQNKTAKCVLCRDRCTKNAERERCTLDRIGVNSVKNAILSATLAPHCSSCPQDSPQGV